MRKSHEDTRKSLLAKMGRLRASQSAPVLAALAVLGVLWIVLPVRLPETGSEPSLADCLTMADSRSQDLAALERCHAIVPADVELSADLGSAYEAARRQDDAIAIYRQVIDLDPLYGDLRLRLAQLLRDRGDTAGARAQIDAALKVQPNRRALTGFQSGAGQ